MMRSEVRVLDRPPENVIPWFDRGIALKQTFLHNTMIWGRIIAGIIGIALGFVILWKSYPIKNLLGQSAWAERNIGSGGTISLIRIVGVLVMALSLMYMTGLLQRILSATVGGIFFGGGAE